MEGDLRSGVYGAVTGPARQSSSSRAAEPAAADDARAVPSRARRRLAAGAVTFAALALGCVAASSAWTRAGGARPPAAELARAGASARESGIEEVTTEVTEGTVNVTKFSSIFRNSYRWL